MNFIGPMASFFIFFQFLSGAYAWELIREKNGIKIFKKAFKNQSLVSFKGEGVVKAPLNVVLGQVISTNRAKKLSVNLKTTKILKWVEYPKRYIEYNEIEMPFFLSNRDFISLVDIKTAEKNRTVTVNYLPINDFAYQTPINPDNELGTLYGSYYKLTSIKEGKETIIEGVVNADPKGFIPIWIVNLFQEDWPYDTIMAVRKYAEGAVENANKHALDLLK